MMVTAEVLKPCTVACQPGSIVEVTEAQFRALGDAVQELSDNIEIKLLDVPDAEKSAPERVENPVETVENVPETPKKRAGRKKA